MAELSVVTVHGSSHAGIAGSNPAEAWVSISFEYCVSGRGLCVGPITRPVEFYRLWCVTLCDLETSKMWRFWPALGCLAREETKLILYDSLHGQKTRVQFSVNSTLQRKELAEFRLQQNWNNYDRKFLQFFLNWTEFRVINRIHAGENPLIASYCSACIKYMTF